MLSKRTIAPKGYCQETHMNKRILPLSLIASAGLLVSGVSHAQLNLQQFGLGGGNSSNNAAASSGGVTQLLQNYVGANQQVLNGQSSLASPIGLPPPTRHPHKPP